MVWLRKVKKFLRYGTFVHFDRIHDCDRQTDRHRTTA